MGGNGHVVIRDEIRNTGRTFDMVELVSFHTKSRKVYPMSQDWHRFAHEGWFALWSRSNHILGM